MDLDIALAVAGIALVASIVTGALGYGFSSISVPLALLFLTTRVLNPALVLVEVMLNTVVLWTNRRVLPAVWRPMLPIVVGLLPGIVVGTILVSRLDSSWLKLGTYGILLPLILFQAAGYRRPMRARRPTRVILGGGVGVLYASTTISGPPLALMLNNQGLSAGEFRGSIAFIRVAESALTAAAYLSAGLFSATSAALVPPMLLGVVAGVPIGAFATHRIEPETFRRVAMAFDAFIVACGLSRTLVELRIASTSTASGLVVLVALIVVALLMAFFRAEPLVSKGVRL